MEKQPEDLHNVRALQQIIERLRGEDGCPWDRKQTARSMSLYLIEEVYELVDAIASEEPETVREEMGDVLFLILFLARLYQEKGLFDIDAAARCSAEKMTRRHPHVFGGTTVDSTEAVKAQWHVIKQAEKKPEHRTSLLDSIPASMPALMRAYRISERAGRAGFDWDDLPGVMEKVEEEWAELKRELGQNPEAVRGEDPRHEKVALEFGDVLFTLTNVARFARIHPETALADSVRKFERRFRWMEGKLTEQGRQVDGTSQTDLDRLWDTAKKETG